jgi:hypothetical protein
LSSCSLHSRSNPPRFWMRAMFLKLNARHSTSLKGMVRRFSSAMSASAALTCVCACV